MGIHKLVFLNLVVVALGCVALAILALARSSAKCPHCHSTKVSIFTVHTRGEISLPHLLTTLSLPGVPEDVSTPVETMGSCDFCSRECTGYRPPSQSCRGI